VVDFFEFYQMVQNRLVFVPVSQYPFIPFHFSRASFNNMHLKIGFYKSTSFQPADHMHHTFDFGRYFIEFSPFGKFRMPEVCLVKAEMPVAGKGFFVVFAMHKEVIHFSGVLKKQKATRRPIRTNADQVIIFHQFRGYKTSDVAIDYVNIPMSPKIIAGNDFFEQKAISRLKITEFVSILDIYGKPQLLSSQVIYFR
jgi:hypothetical protein